MVLTLRCRVAVLGDAAVGKTSLIQMLQSKGTSFPRNYKMTCGAEVITVPINLPETSAGAPETTVELYIYDLGGQEIFREDVLKHLDNVAQVVLVYDITNPRTFDDCDKWLQLMRKSRGDQPVMGALLANKVDLRERQAVATDAAEAYAISHGLKLFECSAMPPGIGVLEPFTTIASNFRAHYEETLEHWARAS